MQHEKLTGRRQHACWLQAQGVDGTLNNTQQSLTVFAPINSAFTKTVFAPVSPCCGPALELTCMSFRADMYEHGASSISLQPVFKEAQNL